VTKENLKPLEKMSRGFGLDWHSKNTFTLYGHKFRIPSSLSDFIFNGEAESEAEEDTFYLAKTADVLRNSFDLFRNRVPDTILELGLYKGGSAALLQLLAKPSKMLALELSTRRLDLLEQFIETEGLTDSMRVVYGVDQADVDTVRALCEEHFGQGRTIDFVLDDASHLLGPTRTSFETIFPYVSPNGSYVIEDFGALPLMLNPWLDKAAHHDVSRNLVELALNDFLEADRRPLHTIVMEATLGCIADPGIISRVVINKNWLRIVRGGKEIEDPENFRLRDMAVDHFGLTDSAPGEMLSPYIKA